MQILQTSPREAPASSEAVSPASYSCCSVSPTCYYAIAIALQYKTDNGGGGSVNAVLVFLVLGTNGKNLSDTFIFSIVFLDMQL